MAQIEASRADAVVTAVLGGPCGCPELHAGSGTCTMRAGIAIAGGGYGYTPMCGPCAACVDSDAPPGRASVSASRYRQTG